MRWTIWSCLVACALFVAGCEGGSGGGPVASAPGAMPPGAPGGPPAAPQPSEPAPPPPDAGTADSPPAQPPGDGLPTPQANPPGEGGPTGGSSDSPPDAPQNPGDPGNPNGGDFGNENPDGTPRRPPPPPRGLREQALALFRSGSDLAGFRLLNGYYAGSDKAKSELATKMAWYPGLMRPALAPRIGIAVHIVEMQPFNLKGSPMPIGSTALTSAVDQMQQAEAADGRIGGTGRPTRFGRGKTGPTQNFTEGAKGDPMQNASPETQISYYLGDFGNWFLAALAERIETGDYGQVLQELVQQRPFRPAPPPGAGGSGSLNGGNPGGDDGSAGYVAPNEGDGPPPGGFAGGGGRGGGRFGGGGGGRGRGQFAGGGGGSALAGAADGLLGEDAAAARTRRWSTRADDRERASLAQVRQIAPCVIWLGKLDKDDISELDKRAAAANIDIVAVYDLTLRQARTGNLVNTTTKLRLMNLKTGKPVANYSPEPLINLDVERWRQKDEKGVDPAEREVMKAVTALDQILRPQPLPETLTAETAKKRIAFLVGQKPEQPLPVVVEARFYLAKGLISQQDFDDAARELIGDSGMASLKARANEE